MASLSWSDLMANASDSGGFAEDVPAPAGEHRMEVVYSKGQLSNKGKPQWNLKFKTDGGPHDGTVVWNRITLSDDSPAALGIAFRQLAALGADSKFLEALPGGPDDERIREVVANKIHGAKVRVKIGLQKGGQYDGKPEVKGILPLPDAAPSAPTPATSAAPAAPAAPAPPKSPF